MTASKTSTPSLLASNRVSAVIATTVVALVGNLVLWLIGLAIGGNFEMTDAGTTMAVAPGGVIMLTVVPIVVGMSLAALVSLRWLGVFRPAQVIGALAPLATIAMTIDADFDGASTAALALMHVVIAVVVPAGLESMRRGALRHADTEERPL